MMDRIYDGDPIIVLYYNIIFYYHCVAIAYSIQYSNMLYRFVAYEQWGVPYRLNV